MSEGEWEEENVDYEDEIGIDTEVPESFDHLGGNAEAFSQWLEHPNKSSELQSTSNHLLYVSPTRSLPSPSSTILYNHVGHNLL